MRYFVFAVRFLVCREVFCFRREVFGFAVRYFVFAVRFLVCRELFCFRREVFCFCREVFGFAVTVVDNHKNVNEFQVKN